MYILYEILGESSKKLLNPIWNYWSITWMQRTTFLSCNFVILICPHCLCFLFLILSSAKYENNLDEHVTSSLTDEHLTAPPLPIIWPFICFCLSKDFDRAPVLSTKTIKYVLSDEFQKIPFQMP